MRLAFCQAHKLVKLEGVFCMSNKTLFAIKKELSAKGVPFDDKIPIHELKKLFDSLPVTSGQIRELKLLGIDYKEKWNWTRKTASEFIRDAEDFIRLRNLLPASPKQRILLMENGIDVPKGTTSAGASKMINELPATDAQLAYFEKNNLKINPAKKLTYGLAHQMIARRERRFLEYKLHNISDKK